MKLTAIPFRSIPTAELLDRVLLIPPGVDRPDEIHTLEAWPGYWVNPRACAVLKGVRMDSLTPLQPAPERAGWNVPADDPDAHLGAVEDV